MPTSRPKVVLDEQSFQDMLAAAFTIQEHNQQRQKEARPTARACGECGADTAGDALLCERCAAQPRRGEVLQRKWASLWLMSQERNLQPEDFSSANSQTHAEADQHSSRRFTEAIEPAPVEKTDDCGVWQREAEETEPLASALATLPDEFSESTEDATDAAFAPGLVEEPPPTGLRDLRLRLRFHRADFYLVVAITVSTLAMVWVLSATPAPGAHRKPRLRPWERALISLGLAEAPEPPARRGNPNISVWVDPKTALYYCAGEELYGKAPGGHPATQREAQLDQFEPAGRAACE